MNKGKEKAKVDKKEKRLKGEKSEKTKSKKFHLVSLFSVLLLSSLVLAIVLCLAIYFLAGTEKNLFSMTGEKPENVSSKFRT